MDFEVFQVLLQHFSFARVAVGTPKIKFGATVIILQDDKRKSRVADIKNGEVCWICNEYLERV